MAKFYLSTRAAEDLTNIWDYTFDEWSERQADKYYQLLIDDCQALAENPNLGKSYNQIANGLFGFKSSKHLIFYLVIDANEIEVVRILYERMDLKKKFL